jgi:hypothetical protein
MPLAALSFSGEIKALMAGPTVRYLACMKTTASYDNYNAVRVIRSDMFTTYPRAVFVGLMTLSARTYLQRSRPALLAGVGIPDVIVRIGGVLRCAIKKTFVAL